MCIGKGVFTFQLSWISAHNSFTYWDSRISVVFHMSDCFDFHIHSQLPVSKTLLEYDLSKKTKIILLHPVLTGFPLQCPSALQHTTLDILKYWKWDCSFQRVVLKNNAQWSAKSLWRKKTPYSTVKINTDLISDEESQSLLTSRWREPSELCVL